MTEGGEERNIEHRYLLLFRIYRRDVAFLLSPGLFAMLTEPTVNVPAAFLSSASFKCSCCSGEVGISCFLMDEAARPRWRCDCCSLALSGGAADFYRSFSLRW